MNKAELVDHVAMTADLPRARAVQAVDAMLSAIGTSLCQGREVRLSGFGAFVPTRRKAAKGRNPRTGEVIDLPASSSVRFRPGQLLRRALGDAGS